MYFRMCHWEHIFSRVIARSPANGGATKQSLLIALIIIFFIFTPIHAAWWNTDIDNIPVPVDAKQTKQEKRIIGGSEFTLTFYTSPSDIEAIKQFYRSNFILSNWKERKPSGLFKDILSQGIIFEKDSNLLTISFTPESLGGKQETFFTVAKGKLQELSENSRPQVDRLLAKPKKDVAPVYPGAVLRSLLEDANFQRAGYSIEGKKIEDVIEFYKEYMPDYGWKLTEEGPLTQMPVSENTEEDILKNCPTCPKNVFELAKTTQISRAELNFANQNQDNCAVFLFNTIIGQDKGNSLNMSTIFIYYEKAK